MITQAEMHKILEDSRAWTTGHYQLPDGRHGEHAVRASLILQYPKMAEMLGSALAELWCESNGQAAVQSIMAINRQGLLLGYELARAMNVRLLYIEKEPSGALVLKQGIRLIPDEKTLLVCDILTGSIKLDEIIDFIKKARASAMGLISLAEINIRESVAVPHRTLARFSFGDYDPAECPLCRAKFPLEKPEE